MKRIDVHCLFASIEFIITQISHCWECGRRRMVYQEVTIMSGLRIVITALAGMAQLTGRRNVHQKFAGLTHGQGQHKPRFQP